MVEKEEIGREELGRGGKGKRREVRNTPSAIPAYARDSNDPQRHN